MQIPPNIRAVLVDPRLRFGFGVAVAFCWYLVAIASEQGRNAAPVVIVGIPAVIVLIWWRIRPWRALLCAAGVLLLIGLIAWVGLAGSGVAIIAATSWFAVLGASASSDRTARWAGAALAAVYTLVSLLTSFGYGNVTSFLFVAVMMALAIALGWGWRQLRTSDRLRTRLVETAARSETAERDVLLELERNRLAREVHDVVAHSLAVVIAQADGARFAAESKPETVAPALEAISDTARRALGEVRTMLHDLRTSGEGGVVPGADDLTGLVEGVRGLGVEVEEVAFGEPRALSRTVGLATYRIAQEALTNAMRHGDRTAPVGFEVDWGEREVVLVVTNAVPDEAVPASERAGHGVTGMRERAADAGGDCSAGVGSNGRYRVRVALPIAEEAADQPEQEPAETNPLVALLAAAGLQPRA